ncbi:hypothetical protein YC2023_063880 [Brassica napus]
MSSDNINNGHGIHPDFWQNAASYHGSSKILIVIILVFSIFILVVCAYHLYPRFVLRGRRRSTFQGHSPTLVTQPPKHGLEIVVIDSLPTFVVGVNGNHDVSATECAVCLALLEEKDAARMLPNCKHVFHVACVDTWLATHSTCPICRSEVEPNKRLEPEPREGPVGDGASSSDYKSGGSSVVRDHYWFNGHGHHSFWPNPSTYDRNSKIMLAAVVSLSAVILFVFILHLYARFVLRRRRETFRGLPVVVRHPFQTPKRGLDPTLIASLPSFTVRDVASAIECAVCLSMLEEQDTARELPSCKHVFHVDCVDKWLTACSICPVCRTEVQPRPRLEPEPREGPVGGDGVSSPPTALPFLDDVLPVEAAASSSSGDKTAVPPVSRLDSFRKILTRERSSNRINHSCVDQERVPDHV